ncbi:MAG TPA: DUF6541 family protein [Pseudonocardia sp.]|nr:DUF6541 family protein [Pseudonocardia sp.]
MIAFDAVSLLAGVMLAVVPGLALIAACGVRSPLLIMALSPTASIGLFLVIAALGGVSGFSFDLLAVGVVTAALLAVGLTRAIRSGVIRRPTRPRAVPSIGLGLVLAGAAIGATTWYRGMDGLATVGQEHDMVTHHLVVAFIARTGLAGPWQLMPSDLLDGGATYFYPAGSLYGPALLASAGMDVVNALNAMTVVYLAVGWSTSVAVLTYLAARRLRLGDSGAWLGAGCAAVLSAGLYRPTFQLIHDGGIYPTAVALALAPGLIAAFLAAGNQRWPLSVPLGFGAAGIVAAYPGAALTVGISVAAWYAGDLVTREGRTRLTRAVVPIAAAGVVGLIVALPLLLRASGSVAGVAGFPANAPATAFGDALGSTIGLPYGGYLDPDRAIGQLAMTGLYLVGVVTVVRLGRGLGPVTAWACWAAITFGAFRSPGTGFEAPVTGFFYNALLRIWSHVALFVPVLAALGVVILTMAVVGVVRRHLPVVVRGSWAVSALVVAFVLAFLSGPGSRSAELAAVAVSERYGDPEFTRVTADDRAAIEWLAERVEPGQRVLNSANDGSTFLYVEEGIPVVNVATLGTGIAPYTHQLLESFDSYPTDPAIREQLVRLNVAWVYVDSEAPGIGAGRSPGGWADPSVPYTLAPGLTDLDEQNLPGLELAFREGSVSVYRLDLESVRALS